MGGAGWGWGVSRGHRGCQVLGCPQPTLFLLLWLSCLWLCLHGPQVEKAPPTAELEPLKDGAVEQTDEQDMGMTYEVGALRA